MLTPRQLEQLRREPAEPNRVKAAIRIAGKTQTEVGAAIGVAQGVVSRVANTSGRGLTVATATRFAAYFGCEIADLFPCESHVQQQGAA